MSQPQPQPQPQPDPHSEPHQEDYKREGVTCAHINFPDNELQIQLIDGNKGSVYSMLDEECLVPKGDEKPTRTPALILTPTPNPNPNTQP